MSLQATEAVLLEMDKEGNILREEKIKIDLVQRGDILKVLISLLCLMQGQWDYVQNFGKLLAALLQIMCAGFSLKYFKILRAIYRLIYYISGA